MTLWSLKVLSVVLVSCSAMNHEVSEEYNPNAASAEKSAWRASNSVDKPGQDVICCQPAAENDRALLSDMNVKLKQYSPQHRVVTKAARRREAVPTKAKAAWTLEEKKAHDTNEKEAAVAVLMMLSQPAPWTKREESYIRIDGDRSLDCAFYERAKIVSMKCIGYNISSWSAIDSQIDCFKTEFARIIHGADMEAYQGPRGRRSYNLDAMTMLVRSDIWGAGNCAARDWEAAKAGQKVKSTAPPPQAQWCHYTNPDDPTELKSCLQNLIRSNIKNKFGSLMKNKA